MTTNVIAQNLVSNPSFENNSSCPSSSGQIDMAVGWSSFGNSPDYLHSCSSTLNVPSTSAGFQCAKTGVAFGGIYTYWNYLGVNNWREFVGSILIDSLLIGQEYFVSVSLNLPNTSGCATNKTGVLFSTKPYTVTLPAPMNNTPHIYDATIVTDTVQWVKIEGSFVADSNYKYVIIGNFFDDVNTDTLTTFNNCIAYYYIDDICVSLDSLTCTDSAMTLSVINFDADTTTINQGACTNFNVNTVVDYGLYEWEFKSGSTTITKTDTAKTVNQCFCEAGTYDVTLIASDSGTCGDTIVKLGYVVVNAGSVTVDSVAVSLCTGDSVFAAGGWQTIAGSYLDTFLNIQGCDSMITTLLSVYPVYGITDPLVSICSSDSVLVYGMFRTTAGTYYDSLTTTQGCDSIRSTILAVNPVYSMTTPDLAICDGDSAMIFGIYRTASATYYDSSLTSNGCDSVVVTNLSIIPDTTVTANASICAGDSIFIGGTWVSAAGNYIDSLLSTAGCDSVTTTVLTVNSLPAVSFSGLDSIYCSTVGGITLTGIPNGGDFSGTGVAGNKFYPATGVNTYIVTYTYMDGLGCTNSESQNVSVILCTSIGESLFASSFLIFPNPVGDKLHIVSTTAEPFIYTIYDLLGRQVANSEIATMQNSEVDLSGLRNSIYFVKVIAGQMTMIRKLVKE